MADDALKVRMLHFNEVNMTPVVPLVHRAYDELMTAGLADYEVALSHDDKAVVAFTQDNIIAGILVYRELKWLRQWWVLIGWVAPQYRRKGVYTRLWAELVKRARKNKNIESITGATSVLNERMREVNASLDRIPHTISYKYPIRGNAITLTPKIKE